MDSFWNGVNIAPFLFQDFKVTSTIEFGCIMAALSLAAIASEGVRTLKDIFLGIFLKRQKDSILKSKVENSPIRPFNAAVFSKRASKSNTTNVSVNSSLEMVSTSSCSNSEDVKTTKDSSYNSNSSKRSSNFCAFPFLIISSFLHMLHVCLGYVLMLAVMTFNTGILIAIAIGAGLGYFIWDILRKKSKHLHFQYR